MFIVFNKEKIFSYAVAVSTIIVLFFMASTIINNKDKIIATSASSKQLPIYSVETNEKQVALTMNCAWNADDIDSILDTLSKNKVHITFFMVGDWVDKYPEYVKKIYDGGHEIANHSNTHPHVNQLNIDKNVEEIKLCSEKIEKITGNKTNLYRGPYGEYNDTVINASNNMNHKTIQWNLDTLDYTGITGEEMWKRLDSKLSNGSIILSHNVTTHTTDSLEMILHNIQEKGYKIVTVSELIYKDNYVIDANGVQKQSKNE